MCVSTAMSENDNGSAPFIVLVYKFHLSIYLRRGKSIGSSFFVDFADGKTFRLSARQDVFSNK